MQCLEPQGQHYIWFSLRNVVPGVLRQHCGRFFPVQYFPDTSETTLHKKITFANADPERTDFVLQENNLRNVFQKKPSRGVLIKSCSENMPQITLQHCCSPVNLLYISRTPFPKNTLWWTASGCLKSAWALYKEGNYLCNVGPTVHSRVVNFVQILLRECCTGQITCEMLTQSAQSSFHSNIT